MIIVDATIVSVAIPSIIRDLHVGIAEAELANSISSLSAGYCCEPPEPTNGPNPLERRRLGPLRRLQVDEGISTRGHHASMHSNSTRALEGVRPLGYVFSPDACVSMRGEYEKGVAPHG